MKPRTNILACLLALLAVCAPAYATVQILSISPSLQPPQPIGASVTWRVTATDSNPGPLTFQFNVALPQHALTMVRDFDAGTLSAGVWAARPFVWVPTAAEGAYQIQVVVKDFTSGETASKAVKYTVNPLVTGSAPVVAATAHPLVALFSAPACAAGSTMRVSFQQQSLATPATTTNFMACHPPTTMNFEIAGMYPGTAYNLFSQTNTGGTVTNGPTLTFTTGTLPANVPFPVLKVKVAAGQRTDNAAPVLLLGPARYGTDPV